MKRARVALTALKAVVPMAKMAGSELNPMSLICQVPVRLLKVAILLSMVVMTGR